MGDVEKLATLNIPYIIVGFITIVVAVVFIIKLIDWAVERFGIETKSSREKHEDHELLQKTVERLEEVNRDSIEHDKRLEKKLDSLSRILLDMQINNMRYEILDFASSLSNNHRYSQEQFTHIFDVYEKYEKVLEENNLSNGQVTASMDVINETYKEKLKNGF